MEDGLPRLVSRYDIDGSTRNPKANHLGLGCSFNLVNNGRFATNLNLGVSWRIISFMADLGPIFWLIYS